MAVITWICTVCWVLQVVQWIVCWALKKPHSSRRSKGDYVQPRHDTIITRLARLDGLMDEMTALKNENSKLNTGSRLRINRLDKHTNDFSVNNPTTTNSKLDEEDVVERMNQIESLIDQFSDGITAQKARNLKPMSTSRRTRYVNVMNRRMNVFHENGSNLIHDVSCLTEKYDTLEKKLNKIDDSTRNCLDELCSKTLRRVDVLNTNYMQLEDQVEDLKHAASTLRSEVTSWNKKFINLEIRLDLL